MFSVDRALARATRKAQKVLAPAWARLCSRFGTPSEESPLSSVHYLLTEYRSPRPTKLTQTYNPQPGPYQVKSWKKKLTVPQRQETVGVYVTCPDVESRELPTFFLSPGLGAHRNANRYLEHHLASYGYLVVRPRHWGSDFWAVAMKTPLGAFTKVEFHRRLQQMKRAMEAALSEELGVKACPKRLALGGHSFGSLTSCVLAGLPTEDWRVDLPCSFRALVALSPYGDSFPTRRLKIDCAGFSEMTLPTLFMSGSRDELFTLGKGASAHLEPFIHSAAENKKHVIIGNTRHGNFSEILGMVKPHTKEMVNSTVLAFLDAHLLGNEEAIRYLRRDLSTAAYAKKSWVL